MEVKVEQSDDESSNIVTYDPCPDQSDKMLNKYSNNDSDVDQPITHSGMSSENTPIEALSVFANETTEENPKSENIRIAPLGDPSVHKKDKVEGLIAEHHSDTKFSESCMNTEIVRNPGIIEKLKKMFGVQKDVTEIKVSTTKESFLRESVKVGKKKLHQKKIAPVIIWDFGGQYVFYSTHQTFLTYRAIYLVVVDGSRTLDEPCLFAQYLPGKSGPKTARDYLKFWINTIVTYCKESRPGFPKIMIILTHKDQVKAGEVESRRQQIFHDIEKIFSGSPLLSHLVIKDRIFVNAKDNHDPEMSVIKKNIIEQAMMQPTWGQKLPKCFIPLELEFDSLLKRNIPLITMEHMKTINRVHPVRSLTEDELQIFLKFQHAVGRILYFEEAHLNQHIILAPTHLIDAFKSIVTDRSFCKGDRLREESWDLMSQKGVIGKKSIDDIWKRNKYKKFQEHKEYLLGVMTHLDILVEPKRYDTSHKRIPAEFFYVASMVRTMNTTGYLESPTFAQRNIAIAFSLSPSMIPPALSFRFVSYCLSLFAIKKYGHDNDMLFHRSAVFTITSSLDMCVSCGDDVIVVRLVNSTDRALIMRDLPSSIRECLAGALEKISQLYVKTSSTGPLTDKASFNLSLCCSSPVDPCLLPMFKLQEQDGTWICPKHGIEHTKDVLSSWSLQKEEIQCGVACPATDTDFLMQFPTDIHLRRLSMQYSVNEAKELAIHLGMQYYTWDRLYTTFKVEPERLNFETLRRCLDGFDITFNDIKKAIEDGSIQNPHTLCKVVRGQLIDFDQEPEKWDLVPSDEHFDKLATLVGDNSLAFLVELGMEFATWEQIRFKQNGRDLVKLNRDILQEWKTTFCSINTIRPSLRHIGQAFINIGKSIKSVENVLTDFF
ncbi:uncharacterized protein [Mytilus edulis]|uniref:uncharacterized protein n=1 Tax=Mytilus edulis TaxID=6550 RepID=UPI0039F0C2CA